MANAAPLRSLAACGGAGCPTGGHTGKACAVRASATGWRLRSKAAGPGPASPCCATGQNPFVFSSNSWALTPACSSARAGELGDREKRHPPADSPRPPLPHVAGPHRPDRNVFFSPSSARTGPASGPPRGRRAPSRAFSPPLPSPSLSGQAGSASSRRSRTPVGPTRPAPLRLPACLTACRKSGVRTYNLGGRKSDEKTRFPGVTYVRGGEVPGGCDVASPGGWPWRLRRPGAALPAERTGRHQPRGRAAGVSGRARGRRQGKWREVSLLRVNGRL